jgi:hypothetical protein
MSSLVFNKKKKFLLRPCGLGVISHGRWGIIRIVITTFINLIYNAHDVAELFILKR